MAITALFTAPSSALPGIPARLAGDTAIAGGGDFASLFSSQLAGQLAGQAALPANAAQTADGIDTTDPALMWLAAALQPQAAMLPVSTTAPQPDQDKGDTGQAAAPLLSALTDPSGQGSASGQAEQVMAMLSGSTITPQVPSPTAATVETPALAGPAQSTVQTPLSAADLALAGNQDSRAFAADPSIHADSSRGMMTDASGQAAATVTTATVAAPAAFPELLAAQQAGANRAAATDSPPPQAATTLPVQTPLHDAGWTEEMGQRLVWMSRNETQQAQLTLNPPHLGPIQVSLSLNNEQLTAQFVSASPEVRQTLEESLPRLREMLAESGISLGQTHVGSESFRQSPQTDEEAGRRGTSRATGDNAILGTVDAQGVHVATIPHPGGRHPDGMLDVFV